MSPNGSHSALLHLPGFRKIKSDPLRIKDAAADVESKFWKFRHEKFQRGRPDLLSEIRKSNHTEPAEKKEVEALKSEVRDLKTRMARMAKDMEKLTSLLQTASAQGMSVTPAPPEASMASQESYIQENATSKKRKVSPMPSPVVSIPDAVSSFQVDGSQEARHSDLLDKNLEKVPTIPSPSKLHKLRDVSGPSFNSLDEEMLTTLFPLEEERSVEDLRPDDNEPLLLNSMCLDDDIDNSVVSSDIPDMAFSLGLSSIQKTQELPNSDKLQLASQIDGSNPNLVEKMKDSLSKLPKNLQQLFVERLVRLITHPEAFQSQVDAVTALAAAAVKEAQSRLEAQKNTTGKVADDIDVLGQSADVATAVLGSFLSRYGASVSVPPVGDDSNQETPTVQ